MTSLEKIFYGLLLSLALSFGGLVYHNALARISILEAYASELGNEVKERAITDLVAITELRTDLKYVRQVAEKIERKLDSLPSPLKLSRSIQGP